MLLRYSELHLTDAPGTRYFLLYVCHHYVHIHIVIASCKLQGQPLYRTAWETFPCCEVPDAVPRNLQLLGEV